MVIGICGKIASGKTEVMKIFVKRGFYPIYADKIVHGLYKRGGKCSKKIASVFGKEFLKKDGSVDRVKLRDVVFTDSRKLKIINRIVHPVVYSEITKVLKRVMKRKQKIAIESAYFAKEFVQKFVDKIIWIERPKEEIIGVLVKKRGFSKKMAENAFGLIDKPFKVDYVLKNYGSLAGLAGAVSIFSSRISLSIVS
ncbi:MAG: dephospho-CoA kinase [Patescibacteria group bacterium]